MMLRTPMVITLLAGVVAAFGPEPSALEEPVSGGSMRPNAAPAVAAAIAPGVAAAVAPGVAAAVSPGVAAAVAPGVASDSSPEAALGQHFDLPEGLSATLWAESPQLFNPTAMDVDAQGRLWVTEAVNYRTWDGRNPGRRHPEGDRVVVLEDRDGDGQAETSTVFVQDPELVAPLGIAVIGDAVYVSCSPNLFVYRDTDGDLRADERETLLTGFGGFDHDHGLHSLVAGPDGRFTLAVGNAGPHRVLDASLRRAHETAVAAAEPDAAPRAPAFTLDSGSVYNGGGPELADNHPGLRSADGRAYTGGLIVRSNAQGDDLTVLAHNFRNNYEVAVDAFGNLWQSDNDDDGNASCRTLWCMEGGDHGYFSADGTRYWGSDRRPGQSTERAHWHQDDPGVVPAGTINGGGGPTGVAVYEGKLLAEWIDGAVLNADAGAGVVYAHRPRAVGAGFELDKTDLIRATAGDGDDADRADWFRPSDVVVGVDGSVFVADWFDPGVGGHAMGDRKAYGRILRIAPTEPSDIVEPGASGPLDTIDAQIAALANAAMHRRAVARDLLAAGGKDAFLDLYSTFKESDDRRLRARCLWLLLGPELEHVSPERGHPLSLGLRDADPEINVTALRAWAQNSGDRLFEQYARSLVSYDLESPAMRREVALRLRPDASLEMLQQLALRLDPQDRWELEAFGLAAEAHGAELIEALRPQGLARDWDERFTALAWRLHPEFLVPAWKERALDEQLDEAQRLQSLDALAFTSGRAAGEAMLDLALQLDAGSVAERAHWWLRHRDSNDWREYGLLAALGDDDLEHAQLLHETDLLRAGLHEVDVALESPTTLWLEVDDGGNGNGCDWAAWIEPRVTLADGSELKLHDQPWVSAESAWGSVHRGNNCFGGPLQVGEQAFEEGLGTHAYSLIRFALPEGAQRFHARVGPDLGGTSQNNGSVTSLRFRVLAATERDAAWYAQRLALVRVPGAPDASSRVRPQTDDLAASARDHARATAGTATAGTATADDDARETAALELAADPQGGLALLAAAADNTLDPGLRELVAEELFRNPDLAVRALASEHFTRPGESARRFPPVPELLAMSGDPARGRDVFLDEATSGCLRCHAYTLGERTVGSSLGPELTGLHEKLDRAQILDSILNPSAALSMGYEASLVELVDGRLLTGFVRADGPTLVLDDTLGKRHVIPAEQVASRRAQRLSVMPDGIATALQPQQLVDLVAFLSVPGTHEYRRGATRALFDGDTLNGWQVIGDPESWSAADGVLSTNGSPAGYLRTEELFTDFELELEWRFEAGVPGNSGVLLRVNGPDTVWPRSLEAQLHAGNAGDIWNIGEFGARTDPARLSGRRTRKLGPSAEKPLGEWNHYRIRLAGPLLELWVNGVLMNTASWCEETPGAIAVQAEGVPVQFRNIRLTPLLR
ncbi:MAG: hypothetical protein DHS20C15_06140 [Planctomycetota bacterium]|nr:MAG: hypothetical protein DHS20C15_06140 [Planctomycetota bacterium]